MSEDDEKRSDALQEMLQKSANDLGEHFESVIIIATNSYDENYVRHKASSGSIYANYGAAREWVISYEEKVKANEYLDDEE